MTIYFFVCGEGFPFLFLFEKLLCYGRDEQGVTQEQERECSRTHTLNGKD